MKIFYAGVIASFLLCAQAQAQSHPVQPLDIESAVEWALEQNFAVRTADLRVVRLGGERQHADRFTPSNPELEISLADRQGSHSNSRDFGIAISQELWIAGQRGLNQRAAQSRLESARADASFLRTAIAARTRRAFLESLLAREAVSSAERADVLAARLVEIAQKRLENGAATRLDLNAAVTGQTRARITLIRAQRDQVSADLQLAELLAVEPGDIRELQGDLSNLSSFDPPEYEALLQISAQRREDLAAAAKRIAAADADLQLAKRELVPNLRVTGFYEEEEDFDIAGARLSLELPLLHRYSGEQTVAAAQLQMAETERQALLLTIRRELRQAVADYRSAVRAVSLMRQNAMQRAEQSVALTQRAFSEGKAAATDIISAQSALLSVRETYLVVLNDFIKAATDLERASGGLLAVHASAQQGDLR